MIGWRETVSLPEWDVGPVSAKIDTGARTSSIHARNIEVLDDGTVRFQVVLRERPAFKSVWVVAELVRESVVKPKPGTRQTRMVVQTLVKVGDDVFEIELNLVNRRGMLCRMLLGRSAIKGRYLVDADRTHVLTRSKSGAAKQARTTPRKST